MVVSLVSWLLRRVIVLLKSSSSESIVILSKLWWRLLVIWPSRCFEINDNRFPWWFLGRVLYMLHVLIVNNRITLPHCTLPINWLRHRNQRSGVYFVRPFIWLMRHSGFSLIDGIELNVRVKSLHHRLSLNFIFKFAHLLLKSKYLSLHLFILSFGLLTLDLCFFDFNCYLCKLTCELAWPVEKNLVLLSYLLY